MHLLYYLFIFVFIVLAWFVMGLAWVARGEADVNGKPERDAGIDPGTVEAWCAWCSRVRVSGRWTAQTFDQEDAKFWSFNGGQCPECFAQLKASLPTTPHLCVSVVK